MATQSAVFTFALPDDADSDQLLIYSATTKDGTYSLDTTVSYEYGTTTQEYDALDDTKWYKVKFNNSTDAEAGAISDAVYGGDFSKSSPFLAVSSLYDGANFASAQDLYDYSGLTTEDISQAKVSTALRRARAVVDHRIADLDVDRFAHLVSGVQRRKYNATLRILKEAEINLALGNAYKSISDDLVIAGVRNELSGDANISIGSTSITGVSTENRTSQMNNIIRLSGDYFVEGERLLAMIQAPSVRLVPEDEFVRKPRFKYPFNGY